jgi:hypothetical protein
VSDHARPKEASFAALLRASLVVTAVSLVLVAILWALFKKLRL